MAEIDLTQQKPSTEEESDRKTDVVTKRRPQNIVSAEIQKPHLRLCSKNGIELRITVHTNDIIQLKYIVPGDQASDFSYAIDPGFAPQEAEFNVEETGTDYQLTTPSVRGQINKKDMRVTFFDRDGNQLCADKKPFLRRETIMKGITDIRITKEAPKGKSYFGLGDKPCTPQLRGRKFENWNTDAYAYERGDDPIYRSIPFYAAVHEGRAYGIFLDNTYRSHFDFDSNENGTSSFSAEGGCMNYYFINGPKLTTVSKRYTKLTGTPELPPMWGLGYHQCRWSYFPDSRVRELAQNFRDKEIPCDAIYLDIDYMDDYRVFTWDKDHFPDPKKLIEELKEKGFETIVMIDPGIKVDHNYPVYQQGLEKDYFCKRADGELMIGPVWPSETVFPDYTHPDVRQWWGDLYEDLISNKKVSGVWNDMNEPAVFEVEKKTFPNSIRHHFDGQPASHKKAHNIYGMQMARASYEGIKKHNQGKRPFLLTRANFSGGQRYAALWTGDNIASWDHLRLANEQCQKLSISGYSFVGTDIGGFVKEPRAELFTRWLQLSVFHPLFRNHSMGYNVDGAAAVKEDKVAKKRLQSDANQEPWSFGDKFTDINRSVIKLRYRLLHYLYTAFRHHVEEGTPVLRPLAYYSQDDEDALARTGEFMFGNQILVSPVLHYHRRSVETYFPKGEWYDYRTNELFEGPEHHTVDAPLAEIPFFIKAGTVLPLREVMQYTQQRNPEVLELNVYYSDTSSKSSLYQDGEEGYDYSTGHYLTTEFELQVTPDKNTATLTANYKGAYTPSHHTVKINFIGFPFTPSSISVDGGKVPIDTTGNRSVFSIDTEPLFEEILLS